MADTEALKAAAAGRALELVRPGMLVGLGTGSTAEQFLKGLAGLVSGGMDITCVATSQAIAGRARQLGINVVDSIDRQIDLAVDGADEIDPQLNLVKGRGGALLREKIVASASRRFVVIADESKLVPRLGRGPVPVEVTPFLWPITAQRLARLAVGVSLRGGQARPFSTDGGNLILDLTLRGASDPQSLGIALKAIPGVVEHGLFLQMAQAAIVATAQGIQVLGSLQE